MELPSDLIIQAVEKPEYRLYAQIFAIYNLVSAIVLLKYFGMVRRCDSYRNGDKF